MLTASSFTLWCENFSTDVSVAGFFVLNVSLDHYTKEKCPEGMFSLLKQKNKL